MAMTPTTTDRFPTIGEEGYEHVMNMSGQRSPYTMEVARKGPTTPDTGGSPAAVKGATMLHEGMGPQFRPVASAVYASDYAATGRNVRQVPSAVGNRDFWQARQMAGE